MMGRGRSQAAWSLVLPVAAAELLLLVATANRYGYHRDELYFRVAARHPAWGYDDQPALTPLLGRLSEWMFGDDPRGLRALSAVAIALVVVLVALIARELGAGRAGQAVAALATAASGAAMAVGHLLSTTTFDVLALGDGGLPRGSNPRRRGRATVAARRPGRRHRAREQAHSFSSSSPLSRAAASSRAAGSSHEVAGCGREPHSRSRCGCRTCSGRRATAGPNSSSPPRSAEEEPLGNRVELLPLQLLLIGPLLAPLWLGGLWWLLRRAEARPYRPLGLAYLVLLAVALRDRSEAVLHDGPAARVARRRRRGRGTLATGPPRSKARARGRDRRFGRRRGSSSHCRSCRSRTCTRRRYPTSTRTR